MGARKGANSHGQRVKAVLAAVGMRRPHTFVDVVQLNARNKRVQKCEEMRGDGGEIGKQ